MNFGRMGVFRAAVLGLAAVFVASIAVASSAAAGANSVPSFAVGELAPNALEPSRIVNREHPKSQNRENISPERVAKIEGSPVATGSATGFVGLTHKDQRLADGGNQFSLEPPDQGLCVGGGEVIESINSVLATYNTSGAVTSPTTSNSRGVSLTKFFTGQSQVTRNASGTIVGYGPFITDPKCYFDPSDQRFFMTVLELDQDPVTGAFTGGSSLLIAVSKSSTPTIDSNAWNIFAVNTRNDGSSGTPAHPGCPCFGDQPLIGADKYGFYVTTNEFSILGPEFNGAQVYAFDKSSLENGVMRMQYVAGAGGPVGLEEGIAYSVQPATSPTAADWSTVKNGTEFLVSALDFNATLDDRIAVWALTNTHSLQSASPDVKLKELTLGSEVYGQPPPADQPKSGPRPLGDSLRPKGKNDQLDTNDDRMNQAVFQGGKLYSALTTALKAKGNLSAGIAYFVVTPGFSGASLTASMANQGYVGVADASVLFPAIAVNAAGNGAMTFTLVGKDYYPSAAYTTFGADGAGSTVQVAAAGQLPEDGFTGYKAFGGNGIARWGDYSAAVPDGAGNIWLATEYIPNSPRTLLANWGTYIFKVP